jgi:hypothetical protein
MGSVTVMELPANQTWLASNTCHLDTGRGRGPSLKDTHEPVELADASTVTVNEICVRESILHSRAKIVKRVVQAGATGAVPSSGAARVRQRQ